MATASDDDDNEVDGDGATGDYDSDGVTGDYDDCLKNAPLSPQVHTCSRHTTGFKNAHG
jgi:hypothetical protein